MRIEKRWNQHSMKKLVQTVIIVLCSLCFSLLLLEIGVRIFAPQPRYYAPQYLFSPDDRLGYKLTPNFNEIYSTPENSIKMRVNSKGLRDSEHGDKKGFRILGLGDSFVMGVGVELEDSFLSKLETYLNQGKTTNQFEVIKAGVQGYGTDQELTYSKMAGWEYKPDLVILGFYPNDIVDNLLPNFTVKDGYLTMADEVSLSKEQKKHPLINYNFIAGLIKNKIQLVRFIIDRVGNIPVCKRYLLESADKLKKTRGERIAVYAKSPHKRIQDGWEETKRLLKEMRDETIINNAKLLVIYIPERVQVYQEQWERVKRQWKLNEIDYNILTPNNILSEFCAENNISFIDLLPEFRNAVEKGEDLYYELDPHLTRKGNEVAANIIYKKLIDDNMISPANMIWEN